MEHPDVVPDPGRQVITRPEHHRDGDPAPWAHLAPERRRGLSLGRIRGTLADRIVMGDGVDVPPEPWRGAGALRPPPWPSAVLVALFDEDGEARVILTVRSTDLRHHQGEVAFPGGRIEHGESVVAAARREAFEEISLDPSLVDVVATLTPMPTLSSNTVMTPVVAALAARPAVDPNPGEVDRVFDVALADLATDGVFHEERWAVPGRPGAPGYPDDEFPVWFFDLAGETIWGATARTLVELVSAVLEVSPPASLPPR